MPFYPTSFNRSSRWSPPSTPSPPSPPPSPPLIDIVLVGANTTSDVYSLHCSYIEQTSRASSGNIFSGETIAKSKEIFTHRITSIIEFTQEKNEIKIIKKADVLCFVFSMDNVLNMGEFFSRLQKLKQHLTSSVMKVLVNHDINRQNNLSENDGKLLARQFGFSAYYECSINNPDSIKKLKCNLSSCSALPSFFSRTFSRSADQSAFANLGEDNPNYFLKIVLTGAANSAETRKLFDKHKEVKLSLFTRHYQDIGEVKEQIWIIPGSKEIIEANPILDYLKEAAILMFAIDCTAEIDEEVITRMQVISAHTNKATKVLVFFNTGSRSVEQQKIIRPTIVGNDLIEKQGFDTYCETDTLHTTVTLYEKINHLHAKKNSLKMRLPKLIQDVSQLFSQIFPTSLRSLRTAEEMQYCDQVTANLEYYNQKLTDIKLFELEIGYARLQRIHKKLQIYLHPPLAQAVNGKDVLSNEAAQLKDSIVNLHAKSAMTISDEEQYRDELLKRVANTQENMDQVKKALAEKTQELTMRQSATKLHSHSENTNLIIIKLQQDIEQLKRKQMVYDNLIQDFNNSQLNQSSLEALQGKLGNDPRYYSYYRTVAIKLEEIFLGYKVLASSVVESSQPQRTTADVKSLLQSGVVLLGLTIPFLSPFTQAVHHSKQEKLAHYISNLGDLKSLQELAISVAFELTVKFHRQILCLASLPDKSTERLAEIAVLRIMHALQSRHITSDHLLTPQLLAAVTAPPKFLEQMQIKIQQLLNTAELRKEKGGTWSAINVYVSSGILNERNEYYARENKDFTNPDPRYWHTDIEQYGYANGSGVEAEARGMQYMKCDIKFSVRPPSPSELLNSPSNVISNNGLYEEIDLYLKQNLPDYDDQFSKIWLKLKQDSKSLYKEIRNRKIAINDLTEYLEDLEERNKWCHRKTETQIDTLKKQQTEFQALQEDNKKQLEALKVKESQSEKTNKKLQQQLETCKSVDLELEKKISDCTTKINFLSKSVTFSHERHQAQQALLDRQASVDSKNELKAFCRRLMIDLNALFLVYRAMSTGKISREGNRADWAAANIENAAAVIPIIGNTIGQVANWTIGYFNGKRRDRQTERVSLMMCDTLSLENSVRWVALELTRRYEEQLMQLTPDGSELLAKSACKYILRYIKEGYADTFDRPAAAASKDIDSTLSFEDHMLEALSTMHLSLGTAGIMKKDIPTKDKTNWTDEGIFQRVGIKVKMPDDSIKYYGNISADKKLKLAYSRFDKYGFRWGELAEIEKAGLKLINQSTPEKPQFVKSSSVETLTTFILESAAVSTSDFYRDKSVQTEPNLYGYEEKIAELSTTIDKVQEKLLEQEKQIRTERGESDSQLTKQLTELIASNQAIFFKKLAKLEKELAAINSDLELVKRRAWKPIGQS